MGTRLVIGFESALSFWRSARVAQLVNRDAAAQEEPGVVFGAGNLTLTERARRALEICCCDGPLDVVIGERDARHNCPLIRDHRWAGPAVGEGLFRVDERMYIYRMPAVLVQLASIWDDVELAMVAMEMPGTYGLSDQLEKGWDVDLAPLITHGELTKYIRASKALGVRGSIRADSALELAVANSNSPRETALAVYFNLSRRRGGAELRGFEMNQPIELMGEQRELAGQDQVKPDFLWECKRVTVEYDSDLTHLNSKQKTKDERRRSALESVGYKPLVVTNGITSDEVALNALTSQLERRLGYRRKPLSAREAALRSMLLRRLFG